jgi:phosphosulfolactate phosphohydrolase-like enzyme
MPASNPAPSRRAVLIDSFPESAFRYLEWDALVCVDVMLSSTTLVAALEQGRRAFVAPDAASARALADEHGPALAWGSDGGVPLPGLDAADFPTELSRRPQEAALVLHSPPGTDLLLNTRTAARSLVLSFANLSATARWLTECCDRVAILGAGVREEFSCEDQMAAAWLAERLVQSGYTTFSRRTADMVQRWSGIEPRLAAWGNSAARLVDLGRKADVDYVAAHVDDSSVVARLHGDELLRADEDRALSSPRAVASGERPASLSEAG